MEIVFHAHHAASSDARYFGTALVDATRRLTMQLDHTKRTPTSRARLARTGAA